VSAAPRLNASMSPAAMIVAIIALVLAGTGVGYAAGSIGTSDLKNDAGTSPKVRNGTLKAADLVKEKPFKYVGAAAFGDGGEGDCVWASAHDQLAGLPRAGYRLDRFGTVHLSGLVVGSDGPGGDAVCSGAEIEDLQLYRLPSGFRPRKLVVRVQTTGTSSGTLIIAGRGGLNAPGLSVPAGVVLWTGDIGFGVVLDGLSFPADSSKVYGRDAARATTSAEGRRLLQGLGLR
jgi:hypothetical protein